MMASQRPVPETVAHLKLEIKQRYDRLARQAAKRNGRSRGMAAIRLAELTRWLDEEYGQGVELPADQHSYMVTRIFAHHLGALNEAPGRIRFWVQTYAPWLKPRDLERLITETQDCPLRWSADKLGWKIKLTDEARTRLKIKTIGALGVSKEQRQARRRKAEAERQRNRRARIKAVRSI